MICDAGGNPDKSIPLDKDKTELTCAAFSPDGTKVVAGFEDGSIGILDLDHGDAKILKYPGHEEAVNSVAFSPDGKQIISGSEDQLIKIWDLKGSCLSTLVGHSDCVLSVAFSPDGKQIISGSEDKEARVWHDRPLDDFLKSNLIDSLSKKQKKAFGIR